MRSRASRKVTHSTTLSQGTPWSRRRPSCAARSNTRTACEGRTETHTHSAITAHPRRRNHEAAGTAAQTAKHGHNTGRVQDASQTRKKHRIVPAKLVLEAAAERADEGLRGAIHRCVRICNIKSKREGMDKRSTGPHRRKGAITISHAISSGAGVRKQNRHTHTQVQAKLKR